MKKLVREFKLVSERNCLEMDNCDCFVANSQTMFMDIEDAVKMFVREFKYQNKILNFKDFPEDCKVEYDFNNEVISALENHRYRVTAKLHYYGDIPYAVYTIHI